MTLPPSTLSDRLPAAAAPGRTLPLVAGGLVAGLVATVTAASFAALLFAGPLAPFLGQALAWALLAALAHLLVAAALCTLPGTLATCQSLPIAVLAAALAAVTAAVTASGAAPPAVLLATAAATLMLGTALTGAALLLLGRSGAGRLARFLPYPVLVGVMGSSGWLLAESALHLLRHAVAGAAAGPTTWVAAAWAVLMLVAHRRRPHPLTTLVLLGLGAALWHGAAAWWGWSADNGVRDGWLPAAAATALPVPLLAAFSWSDVDLPAIVAAAPLLAAAPVVTAIALLMNAAALETAVRQPLDLNRELRAAGLGNLAAAAAGGLPGYHQLGLSAMNLGQGLRQRRIALWAAAPCLAALLAGPALLSWLPRPVMGALLLFLALQLMHDAALGSWARLSRLDRAIVAMVIGVTVTAGFLAGLLAGLVAAVVLFAVYCARVDPVRQDASGSTCGSRVERGPVRDAQVRRLAAAVQVLQLQGFLFFGLADRLQQRVHARLADAAAPRLQYLVLDCRRVLGSDSSAIHGFTLLAETLGANGVTLVVAHASPRMQAQLAESGLGPGPRCHLVGDLDRGLEWCEEALLAAAGGAAVSGPESTGPDLSALAPLLQRLVRIELPAGGRLIAKGDADRDLYLLVSGAVSAVSQQADGSTVRLQTMRGGAMVLGEVGFFTGAPRTADVVADAPSVVYRLGQDELRRLERDEPGLAVMLHRLVAQALAGRIAHLVTVVEELEA